MSTVDELRAALDRSTSEVERVDAMIALAYALHDSDPQEAARIAESAVELARGDGAADRYPRAVAALGRARGYIRDCGRSLEHLTEAQALFAERGDARGAMEVASAIGRTCSLLGRFDEAEVHLLRALEVAEETGDRSFAAETTTALGQVVAATDPGRSVAYFRSGLAVAKEVGRESVVAECLEGIGNHHFRRGEYADALDAFREALAIGDAIGVRRLVTRFRQRIGDAQLHLGNYAAALDQYQSMMELATELNDRSSIAYASASIGNVHYLQDNDSLALEYYQRALDHWTDLGMENLVAYWRPSVGHVLERAGELDQALEHYRAALSWAREHGPRHSMAVCLSDIADIHLLRGKYAEALDHYREALAISEEFDATPDIAHHTGCIGHVYSLTSFDGYDPERAEELLKRAIELSAEAGYPSSLVEDHLRLGTLYRQEGRWQEALEQTIRYYEIREQLRTEEAQRKAQQVEHERRIAQLERERAVEKAESEAAREIAHMKSEQLERELANTTLQLLAQTEALEEIRSDLTRILRKIPPSEPAAHELRERIKTLPSRGVDWALFDEQFRAVHPEFVRRLTERAPSLTATELRVCALVRMNLRTREIARIVGTTDKGIDFHRCNIRRKLEMSRDEKLPIVLATM